ncbi:helix-turn-helix domain-containing protein [Aurantimonas coralicida]|uniref:helix-turn-helix domain-containing protein n=1 Tax=Aurantimonas coralicida TaxID=182270 RepID=UPI001E5176F0|nr:helix-turn-helix domain-containing protein [Aurantimonas coralicida]MCD1642457.1 helix-turn-helix domain-containing protein [Aurantimonas coralicida]
MDHANDNPADGDLLIGAAAIARFLGVSRRQVYRLVYDRIAPSFKLGGTIAARRSSLTKWLTECESADVRVSA